MGQKTASAHKSTWREKMAALGPGFLIVDSFIGPGTVTSSIQAGATYGLQLLWYVVFSVIVVIVVQGMSVRLGIIIQEELTENLKNDFTDCPSLRSLFCGLVALVIATGGFAYMDEDLIGTVLDINALTDISTKITAPVWGLCILLILSFTGDAVKYLKKLPGIYVTITAVVFMVIVVTVRPGLGAMFMGYVPNIPENSGLMTCLSLIGATVVPYNTFLHVAGVKRTWHGAEKLPLCNFDTTLSMTVDGVITGSIMVTSAVIMHGMAVNNAMNTAIQLKPTLGALARPFMTIGLVAAGVSSAVCAPMGVSHVLAGLLGWKIDSSDRRYTSTSTAILTTNVVIAVLGTDPLGLIITTRTVNSIVLPVIVGVAVYLTCHEEITGQYKNSTLQTILGVIILTISLILGVSSFLGAFSQSSFRLNLVFSFLVVLVPPVRCLNIARCRPKPTRLYSDDTAGFQ